MAATARGCYSSTAVRILVVDDDQDLNLMLSRFLEKHGYEVTCAGDALQALDSVERQPPDFIIADLMMPVVDGLVFLEMLKADPRRRDVPATARNRTRASPPGGTVPTAPFRLSGATSRASRPLPRPDHR